MEKGIVYLFFLAVHTVTDIREKQIYVAVLALQALVGAFFQICDKQVGAGTVLSCLPGLFCLGAGRLSGEKIGYGDGWMVLLGGLFLSPWQLAIQLLAASIAAWLYGLGLLAAGRLSGKKEIPFAPFFLFGYLGSVLYGQG